MVSEEEGLYDTVKGRISEESPEATVRRADSVREGVAILERTGSGIILTDLRRFDPHFRFSVKRKKPKIRKVVPEKPEEELVFPEVQSGNTKADLGTIKQFVRMHLEEDLSLTRLSQMACLSPNYLSYLFKKREGEPLKKYIERHRIERAAYLLLTEESTMSEIAAKIGYRYSSYFCNVFKDYYGVSPLQFRLRYREQRRKSRRKK